MVKFLFLCHTSPQSANFLLNWLMFPSVPGVGVLYSIYFLGFSVPFPFSLTSSFFLSLRSQASFWHDGSYVFGGLPDSNVVWWLPSIVTISIIAWSSHTWSHLSKFTLPLLLDIWLGLIPHLLIILPCLSSLKSSEKKIAQCVFCWMYMLYEAWEKT